MCIMTKLTTHYFWVCSECGESHERGHEYRYCPWCGSKIEAYKENNGPDPDAIADIAWDRWKEAQA